RPGHSRQGREAERHEIHGDWRHAGWVRIRGRLAVLATGGADTGPEHASVDPEPYRGRPTRAQRDDRYAARGAVDDRAGGPAVRARSTGVDETRRRAAPRALRRVDAIARPDLRWYRRLCAVDRRGERSGAAARPDDAAGAGTGRADGARCRAREPNDLSFLPAGDVGQCRRRARDPARIVAVAYAQLVGCPRLD